MIIWKNEWLWEDESVWSFVNKLEFSNQINGSDIKNIFKYKKNNKLLQNIKDYYLGSFMLDYDSIKEKFGLDLVERQKNNIQRIINPFNLNSFITAEKYLYAESKWFHENLYFCPECIKVGYHSLRHQFKFNNNKCHIHNIELLNHCPHCGSEIPYRLMYNKTNTYYVCECNYRLFDLSFDEAYNIWEKPLLIRNKSLIIDNSKMFIFIPKNEPFNYQLGATYNQIISNLCSNTNVNSTYSFSIPKEEKLCTEYISKYIYNSKSIDIYSIYWKATQVVERHIRKSMQIKKVNLTYSFDDPVTNFNCKSISYYIFIKYVEGIREMCCIHSEYMKNCRYHFYDHAWGVRYILLNIKHIEALKRFLPNNIFFVYFNIIYRLFLIHSLHIYESILNKVEAEYKSVKLKNIADYYDKFSFIDILDPSVYIIEIDEDHGKLWDIQDMQIV